MPEGRIPLAEAVVYLATAPKSNAVIPGSAKAIADVRAGKIGRVPPGLRDAHYAGAKKLGHGKGYRTRTTPSSEWSSSSTRRMSCATRATTSRQSMATSGT